MVLRNRKAAAACEPGGTEGWEAVGVAMAGREPCSAAPPAFTATQRPAQARCRRRLATATAAARPPARLFKAGHAGGGADELDLLV